MPKGLLLHATADLIEHLVAEAARAGRADTHTAALPHAAGSPGCRRISSMPPGVPARWQVDAL